MKRLTIRNQITDKSSLSFEKYLQEVSKLPEPLMPEEEVKIISKVKQGDKKAEKELILRNLRFVISVAKQYQNQENPINDLVNEGNIGLIKAVHRFDGNLRVRFISYAVWWIRQSILKFINEDGKIIKLPANKIHQLSQIKKAKKKLEALLCRNPTIEEIQNEINNSNIKRSDIVVILETDKEIFSLTAPISGEKDSSDNIQLIDFIKDNNTEATDKKVIQESLTFNINTLLLKLPERNQKILIHYFGLNNNRSKTLAEISEILNLTRERIRQLKNESINELKQFPEFKKFL